MSQPLPFLQKAASLAVIVLSGLCPHFVKSTRAQVTGPQTRLYRGSIGNKHIEMRLKVEGSKVSGTYSYDQFRQDLKLAGSYNSNGELDLSETGQGNRKTGKFSCKAKPETFDADVECEWSRPDGTGKTLVVLYEQNLTFGNGIDIAPKLITDRKSGVVVSYPQLVSTSSSRAVTDFNRLITSLVQKAIKDFMPEASARASLDTNYNVMLGTDNLVSIEMEEYSYSGGAHPNTTLWTVNYDLKANKQLSLADVFQPKAEYKSTIAEFVVKNINIRAEQIERDEARRDGRQPEKRDEPLMTADQLPEIDAWAVSPKGLAIYFDFPHAIAVFDKTVVPYSVIQAYLRTDGPAASFVR
jgi:Deacetylase PdaC